MGLDKRKQICYNNLTAWSKLEDPRRMERRGGRKHPADLSELTCFDWRFTLCLCEEYHAAAGKRKIPAENKKMESVWQRPWSLPVGEDHRKQALC